MPTFPGAPVLRVNIGSPATRSLVFHQFRSLFAQRKQRSQPSANAPRPIVFFWLRVKVATPPCRRGLDQSLFDGASDGFPPPPHPKRDRSEARLQNRPGLGYFRLI